MKKFIFTFLILLLIQNAFSQKTEDNLIIVTVSDTTNIYQKVRQAITYTNLIIREDSKRDTLVTYSERIHGFTIFVVAKVVIAGSKVEISGGYGLGLEDFWGYPAWPKSYKPIIYFKGSEAWQILRQIAIKLDGMIEFSFRN
jgi:hypothetical protein